MTKKDYTHVQALLAEIKAIVESRKTQREIAEHYGYKDKFVVQSWITPFFLNPAIIRRYRKTPVYRGSLTS